MAKNRQTQLAEHHSPSGGAHSILWDNSDTPCGSFHINGVDSDIDVEFMDGTTATLHVLQGKSYYYHIKSFKSTGDKPDGVYFDV